MLLSKRSRSDFYLADTFVKVGDSLVSPTNSTNQQSLKNINDVSKVKKHRRVNTLIPDLQSDYFDKPVEEGTLGRNASMKVLMPRSSSVCAPAELTQGGLGESLTSSILGYPETAGRTTQGENTYIPESNMSSVRTILDKQRAADPSYGQFKYTLHSPKRSIEFHENMQSVHYPTSSTLTSPKSIKPTMTSMIGDNNKWRENFDTYLESLHSTSDVQNLEQFKQRLIQPKRPKEFRSSMQSSPVVNHKRQLSIPKIKDITTADSPYNLQHQKPSSSRTDTFKADVLQQFLGKPKINLLGPSASTRNNFNNNATAANTMQNSYFPSMNPTPRSQISMLSPNHSKERAAPQKFTKILQLEHESSETLSILDQSPSNTRSLFKNNRSISHSGFPGTLMSLDSKHHHKSPQHNQHKIGMIMKHPTPNYYERTQPLSEKLIKDLSYNINRLVTVNRNERVISETIKRLAEDDSHILPIVHYKYHLRKDMRIEDVYSSKYEKRLSAIRVINEPVPPLKWKYPYPTIDNSTLRKLQDFCEKLDEYNIKVQAENIKRLEEVLIKSHIQTAQNQEKLRLRLSKCHPAISSTVSNMQNRREQAQLQMLLYRDPMSQIEEYESHFGELKDIQNRNRTTALRLRELVSNFAKSSRVDVETVE